MITVDFKFKVSEYLDSISADARRRLLLVCDQMSQEVRSVAISLAPKRSGRLSSNIVAKTKSTQTRVQGLVQAFSAQAHFLEAGFHGSEQVSAHYRTIRQAFGRPISPKSILVKAYTRNIDFAAHPFMRPALAQAEPRIRTLLTDAVDKATKA